MRILPPVLVRPDAAILGMLDDIEHIRRTEGLDHVADVTCRQIERRSVAFAVHDRTATETETARATREAA